MTSPEAQEPAPQPPPRPAGGQLAAADAQLENDLSALEPAVAAAILAILAYGRAGRKIAGTPLEIAEAIGYAGLIVAALSLIAQRNLEHQRTWTGKRAAEELWAHQDTGVQAGVDAGLRVLAQAAPHIVSAAAKDEADGVSPPGLSLPGEPYDPNPMNDVPHEQSYADPQKLALPVVQATRHEAQLAVAEEAGWTRKSWMDKRDNRVRVNHAFLGSKKYEYHTVPILEPFVDLDGNKLWYPGDTSAPPAAWMRCRCHMLLSK